MVSRCHTLTRLRPDYFRCGCLLIALLVFAGLGLFERAAPARADASSIRHVFVIVLENESASTTFGPGSPAPYLASTLPSQGAFLPNYFAVGHNSLDNYIAMISGQAPNAQTQSDCQNFFDWPAGSFLDASGQENSPNPGDGGCVYPANVPTIAGQLNGAGLTWRDYSEDMGNDPSREAATCGHPPVGSPDNTQKAEVGDQYATRHNPFMYFHSIIDNTTLCNTDVVNLNQLPQDLSSVATTPNYSFITPNLCDDGHDSPCVDGEPGGLTQVNQWLQTWVPKITASPAFRQNGLLLVTFDEAADSDTSSCCGEIPGPDAAMPGSGPGGGNVGAVLLSPCIAPGTVSTTSYNHYSMLRSIEDSFGLSHLAYANLAGQTTFGSDIYNRPCGSAAPTASINAPPLLSRVSTRARIHVSWSSDTSGGTPLSSYTVRVQDQSVKHPQWRTLVTGTQHTSLTFTGSLGHSYAFQVQAANTAGQTSAFAATSSVIPSGARPSKGHFSRGWRIHHQRGAWQGRAITSQTNGATFKLRYVGGSLALIGETTRAGGAARVTLDGRSRTIRLHSSRLRTEQVLYSVTLRSRVHHLTVKVLRGTVALEGVAITSRTG